MAERKSQGRSWSHFWRRVASMSHGEISDRVRQGLCMRIDALRYQLGANFAPGLSSSPLGSQPRFFFAPEQVPSLCDLLGERFPEETRQIIERAERICRHRFDLLGYQGLEYGDPIDWRLDRVHGKRAPRKPWFQVPYLDFAEVGDSKITWELNRHQHWLTLAKAFRLTGEKRFAAELFQQWRQWHAENPYPIGINWASSLEVAFRSLSWLWVYFLLEESATMPPDFQDQWLRAMGISGRHIETYLSTYFSPNTHLLGEAVALFFIGTLCPQLRFAARWKQRGWNVVLKQAQRQVQGDGLHFERSVYYHVYALDLFLHAVILASVNQVPIPQEFETTIEKMLDALCLLGRAGPPPGLGDDDGGRVFDPRRNRGEHMLDPLATGAVLFGRGDFKDVAGGAREETLWLLGPEGLSRFDQVTAKSAEAKSAALTASGLYLMANAGPGRQLVIDGGPQGGAGAGHGHADILSLCANHKGLPLLIDLGTCEYVGEGDLRNQFRGTASHNTLCVDGLDQAEPAGPFAWRRWPKVKVEGWITGEMFDLFTGSHDSYNRLTAPVVHRRWVFSLKLGFWLVRDVAEGTGKHQLDLFWHLAPGLHPEPKADECCGVFLNANGVPEIAFLTASPVEWTREIRRDSWSPTYGRKEPAFSLHFSSMAELPAEFVTWMVPLPSATAGLGQLNSITAEAGASNARGYRYTQPEEEHTVVFRWQNGSWSLGPWSSDADFLYWGVENGRRTLILCNGSYLDAGGGHRVFFSKRRVLRSEIIEEGPVTQVFSSDKDAIEFNGSLAEIATETGMTVVSDLKETGQ